MPHTYTIEIDTWIRDPSRIDAYELRLRVWRDGEYFQFFKVVVAGIDLATKVSNRDPDYQTRFWHWLAALALPDIERAILERRAPRPNPIDAIEVRSDLKKAAHNAKSAGPRFEQRVDGRTVLDQRIELQI
jgi:hypothetical protein